MITSLLFVLTGSLPWISFICATTLVSWLTLSDFFMTDRFNWWGTGFEEGAFSLPSLGVAALVVVIHYYRVRVLAEEAPAVELVPNPRSFTADNVGVILSAVANTKPFRQPRRGLHRIVPQNVLSQRRGWLFYRVVTRNVPSYGIKRFLLWKVQRIERLDTEQR